MNRVLQCFGPCTALVVLGLLAGCEAKTKSEARDRYLNAVKTFDEKVKAYDDYLVKAAFNGDKSLHQNCVRLLQDIDPFYPPGVDPELAAAIRRYKEAKIDYHNTFIYGNGNDIEMNKTKNKLAETAKTDVKEVRNKLAIKYDIAN